MDGFEADNGVVVLAATNRMGDLDPALLRPGRFDRKIVVPLPHLEARRDILKVHSRKSPVGADVDFEKVAEDTAGFSGADLANLTNEAAILAAKRGKHLVEMADFDDARDHIAKRTADGTWSDFGKSKAQYTGKDQDKTTFADVAGVDSAKEDLQDVIDFLKNPEKLQGLGGKVPRGRRPIL
jgi:ATP-dependent Zn protease